MKLLRLEFYKCRRRRITLICAGILAAQLLWFGAYLTRQDPEDLAQGWMLMLYNLALVDAILLPVGTAAVKPPSPPAGSTMPSWSGGPWCCWP